MFKKKSAFTPSNATKRIQVAQSLAQIHALKKRKHYAEAQALIRQHLQEFPCHAELRALNRAITQLQGTK